MSFACRFRKGSSLYLTGSNVTGTDSGGAGSGSVASDTGPSASVDNGSGSYSYSWARVSGDSPSCSNSAVLNPTWHATVADGVPNVSTWRLTVTDLSTGVTATMDITVTLVWINNA